MTSNVEHCFNGTTVMYWFSDIKIEDLPPGKMTDIANKNGIEDAVILMQRVPGLQLYIPVYGKKKLNKEYIDINYTGQNLLSISVHLGLGTKKVNYMIKGKCDFKKDFISNKYMRIVAEHCGKDVVRRLISNFYGDDIYIPICGFLSIRRAKIVKEFDGSNSTQLAIKYGVSERYIQQIIADLYNVKSAVQLDLFAKNA